MFSALPTAMTVDEFLLWSMDQESGRYELEHGRVVRLAQENFRHVCCKASAYRAFASAIACLTSPWPMGSRSKLAMIGAWSRTLSLPPVQSRQTTR